MRPSQGPWGTAPHPCGVVGGLNGSPTGFVAHCQPHVGTKPQTTRTLGWPSLLTPHLLQSKPLVPTERTGMVGQCRLGLHLCPSVTVSDPLYKEPWFAWSVSG
jgi:hypothetical protein